MTIILPVSRHEGFQMEGDPNLQASSSALLGLRGRKVRSLTPTFQSKGEVSSPEWILGIDEWEKSLLLSFIL